MSEPLETAPPIEPTPQPAAQPAVPANWDELFKGQDPQDVLKALGESRKWEARAKENKSKADQFSALEEASKSDAQRREEALAQAQRDAESARTEAIRYKVAATHGIPAEHFDLLGTGSEEQVTANAQKVAALLAAQAAAQTTTTVPPVIPTRLPVEQMRPGATPAGTETEEDVVMAQLFGPPK